jgi:hypothetical protein
MYTRERGRCVGFSAIGVDNLEEKRKMSETVENGSTSNASPLPEATHINNVDFLDLTSAKTPDDLQGIARITNVDCILIPEHLMATLTRIPMDNVDAVIPVPAGENFKLLVGQVFLTGEALSAGNPEEILFVAGQLFITTPATSVGYREIRVHGQVMAPRGSETALGAKMGRLTGQIFYLPAKARMIMGEEAIGKAFLELLPEPAAFVVMGGLTIEDDVTVELLKEKVPEIVLFGNIRAPQALVPLLQVLSPQRFGEIVVKE